MAPLVGVEAPVLVYVSVELDLIHLHLILVRALLLELVPVRI